MNNQGIASTVVFTELPFCLYLNDGMYELLSENQPAAIQLFRRPRHSTVQDLPFNRGGVILGIDPSNCEITGDRFGRVAFSQVVVSMPSPESIDEPDPIIEKAVTCINRLIQVYRAATGEFWIQPISTADIVCTQFRHCDENGNDIPGISYAGPQQAPGFTIGSPLQIISSGTDAIKRSPETHTKILDMLKHDTKIPTYTTLMLDAQSSIRFGRFSLAVVEAQTAFENFFHTFVDYELRRKKLMSPILQRQLDKGTLTQPIKRSVAGLASIDKLAFFSKLVTDPPLSFSMGVAERDKWYLHTYKLRNYVIHKGKSDVTEKQAEDAFEAVNNAISFFKQDWKNLTFV
ncbi:hypothetical protein ACFLV3_06165 [Chloroflexota bacterium]